MLKAFPSRHIKSLSLAHTFRHRRTPRRRINGGQIYRGKVVSAPPGRACTPRESPSFGEIGEIWTAGVVNLVVLACVLRVTTKEKVVSFFGKEKYSPEKILATPLCSGGG